MPCTMSLVEMKSLFRMDEIIASAPQPITVLEVSAHSGQGLQEVLNWLESIAIKWTTSHLIFMRLMGLQTMSSDISIFGVKRLFTHPVEVVLSLEVTGWCEEVLTRKNINAVCGTQSRRDDGIIKSMIGHLKLVESAPLWVLLLLCYCNSEMQKFPAVWSQDRCLCNLNNNNI